MVWKISIKKIEKQKIYLTQYASKSERLDFTQELDLEYSYLRKLSFDTQDIMLLGLLNETSINLKLVDYIEMFENIVNAFLNNTKKDDE